MNKHLIVAAAAALTAFALPSFAQQSTTGMQGYVIDGTSKKPLGGVAVLVQRIPQDDQRYSTITDRRGFFNRLGVEPGRYLVTANVIGHKATCEIDDVDSGIVRRFNIVVDPPSGAPYCQGPHSRLVNGDETTSAYHIH